MTDLERKLLKDGWVSADKMLKARDDQAKKKKSIFSSLVSLRYMSEEDVFKFFALNTNIPFVRLSDYKISKDVISLVKEDFCRENLIIPLFKMNFTLFTAMANPLDTNLVIRIYDSTKLEVEPLLASPDDIIKAINYYFGFPGTFFSIESLIFESQELSKFPFYRASSRRNVSAPIELIVKDERLSLSPNVSIRTVTLNISDDGKAMGIKAPVFLPKGARLEVSFLQENSENVSINTEVIHCHMSKINEFLIGLKVLDKDENVISYLKSLTEHR